MLAEAAESVATPQIRNVGTLAGNVCQRPWCWYYRNGFRASRTAATTCFSVAGENQFHAIFGGGPSYIVHPSDTAPALVALDATFRIVGPAASATCPAADFFVLPTAERGARERAGRRRSARVGAAAGRARRARAARYHKVLDREAWTHAVVSAAVVLEMDGDVCRGARVVLGGVAPIPWRLPEVERALAGQRITEALAAKAGEIGRRRRAAAGEERLQGSADAGIWCAGRSSTWRDEPPRLSFVQAGARPEDCGVVVRAAVHARG